MNKYNELFKQLVSAGLVYHNHTDKPYYRSKRVKVKWVILNFAKDRSVTDTQQRIDLKETEKTKLSKPEEDHQCIMAKEVFVLWIVIMIGQKLL